MHVIDPLVGPSPRVRWACRGPIRTAGAVVLGLVAACSRAPALGTNVILITLDTTRSDYLSCYDPAKGPTPNFDALAREGARCERALSTSAVTPVSHATILTGRYPYHHGLRVLSAQSGFRLPATEITLARRLKAEGYTTLAVHSAFPVSSHFGFGRDFHVFESMEGDMRDGRWNTTNLQRRSDDTVAKVIEVVDGAEQPFFLWIHLWDPHDVIVRPPREWIEADGISLDEQGEYADPKRELDLIYNNEVRFLDAQFGRMVEALRARGLWDGSLVALTADHGQGLNDGLTRHGWQAHRMVYEEQIRVPLLLRGPGIPAGVVVRGLARTADIVPTLYDYLGLPPEPEFDGRSLRDPIEGRPSAPRDFYAEQINGYDTNARLVKEKPASAFLYTVGDEKWKLTYRPHMPDQSELFDLENDPLELDNLIGKRKDVALEWMEELASRAPWVLEPFAVDEASAGPDVSAALGSLGYAEGEIYEQAWEWFCPEHDQHRQPRPVPERHADCGRLLVPVVAR